jgi:hypothetical protein
MLQYNTDEYRYFAIHSNFTDTVYVSKIEVIAGLPAAVHHADIHFDMSGTSFYNDSISPLPGFSGGIVSSHYMNAWQPGGNIAEYPPGWGIAVPPGADFVMEVHYGPGHIGEIDSTKMNLRFITNPVNVRPIHVQWMLNGPIPSQGPLIIPPDSVITFNQVSPPMSVDRSLISICPHMHLLGNSYKVWYKTATNDSVPLINIPHWDFHWQKYYMFQNVLKIPIGARIYAEATYDNTTNNPHNPNNPPITVQYGPTTEDEMLMTYFIYAEYEPGDENIILDSLLLSTNHFLQESKRNNLNIFPNPSNDFITIESSDFKNSIVSIHDYFGRIRKKLNLHQSDKIDIRDLNPGMYLVTIHSDRNQIVSSKILIKE